ncbi:thiamine pyrophosphate-dependent acetolactate synthase large subunit-like protein [Sinorhizobium medicae]
MTVAFRSKPVTVEDPAYRGLAIGTYAPAVTPAPAFAQTDLKIPYVTELLSKAILPDDDAQFAGVFDGKSSSPYVQSLVESSDFVLALGRKLIKSLVV